MAPSSTKVLWADITDVVGDVANDVSVHKKFTDFVPHTTIEHIGNESTEFEKILSLRDEKVGIRKRARARRSLRRRTLHAAAEAAAAGGRRKSLRYILLLYLSSATTVHGFDRRSCNRSFGMEWGGIDDEQISASSQFVSTVGAVHSRLNNDRAGGAWCPRPQIHAGTREYLEIDFLDVRVVTQIATQGRNDKGRGQEYMEEFTIEYYRPTLGRWREYQRWDGKKLLTGNSDTKTIVLTRLEPAIIATKIRVLPYSVHLRSVCARVEFYGCRDDSGLMSYTVPPTTGIVGDLNDTTYDGTVLNDGTLVDGLGRLADGQVGADSFTLDVGQGKGSGWVAWKNTTFSKKCVELLFEFDSLRNFTQINIYTNNFFHKKAQIFGRAVVYFHVEGMLYKDEPVIFHPRADLQSEKARNVSINIQGGAVAKLIKIKLYFVQEWLMIGEIYFTSELLTFNISMENLKLLIEDDSQPKFDKYGNIVLEGGSLSSAYDIYFYIQYTLGIIIALGIVAGLAYITLFYLNKRDGPNAETQARRRLSRKNVMEWVARWSSRGSETGGDAEAAESVVKLELRAVHPVVDVDPYYDNPYQSKQAVTQLTRSGFVTRITPGPAAKETHIMIDHDGYMQSNLKNTLQPVGVARSTLRTQIRNAVNPPASEAAQVHVTPNIRHLNNASMNHEKFPHRNYYTGFQIDDEVYDDQTIAILQSTRQQTHNRSVSFGSVDNDNGGFDEYRNLHVNRRRTLIKSGRYAQKSLQAKIEHLLMNRGSMSARDKIQLGPDYLWNIGASDTAPKIYPEGELVPIPLTGLTQHTRFSSYLDREVCICSTEKLRAIIKEAPAIVAVRMAKLQKDEDCVEYFQEVRLLASLSHPGLCNVIGIVTSQIPPLIVQEFTPGEDLCHMLRSSPNMPPSFRTIIYIITQICCSMRYLESLFMVHRDLAARNCLLYPRNRVKVTDLAMYSNTYKSDYHHTTTGRRLPLRWMSWEAILLGRTTCASTVWSFAITSWEIFEQCSVRPFSEFSDTQLVNLFEKLFYEGEHQGTFRIIEALPKPNKCPSDLYRMLKRCWKQFEEERPSFDELYTFMMQHYYEELPVEYHL